MCGADRHCAVPIGAIVVAAILLSAIAPVPPAIIRVTGRLHLRSTGWSTVQSVCDGPSVPLPSPPRHYHQSSYDAKGVEYEVINTPQSFDGYNLFVLGRLDRSTISPDSMLLVMDMDGNILLQEPLGSTAVLNLPVEFVTPYTILTSGPQGAALWDFVNNSYEYLGFSGHHEYEYNPNNDTFFTFGQYYAESGGVDCLFDDIREYNRTGGLVWSMRTSDFLSYSMWCPSHDRLSGVPDISHSNTIFYDADEDMIYYNSRNTNTFFKIDHKTGNVVWGLGEYGDFTLYDQYGRQRECLFYHAHSVERVDDNTFILFDNDLHNQTGIVNSRSRLLEITVNETDMTAYVSWAWTPSTDYYCAGWGDADRLPNGNRLGTFGYWRARANGKSAYLVEVTPSGDVAWEVSFPVTADYLYGVYRMERFRSSPVLDSPDDVWAQPGTPVNITWRAWFNYRNKMTLPGQYTLYLDDDEVAQGSFKFDRFWRPTTLAFQLGVLPEGLHNVTLVIQNQYGQTTADTVEVLVEVVGLRRSGPTVIEVGANDTVLRWSGYAAGPVTYELLSDGTTVASGPWEGGDIGLDLVALGTGTHNITLCIWNGTELLYDESVWVTVYPAEPPVIDGPPALLDVTWGNTVSLSWTLSDNLPDSWTLYVDGQEVMGEQWAGSPHTVVWEVPVLDEGTYNITLVARDAAGHSTHQMTTYVVSSPSPPVIVGPLHPSVVLWGSDLTLQWEVHGGVAWELWRNGSLFSTGPVSGARVSVPVANWTAERWFPCHYNLTLRVWDSEADSLSSSILSVEYRMGDPYVDAVVEARSLWCVDLDASIGPPDGRYTTVTFNYDNGYLTVDMGLHEEVLDGEGSDFTVVATGGRYRVFVAMTADSPFISLGLGHENSSFDLATAGLPWVRYIRVRFVSGEDVRVDAIVAAHYQVMLADTEPPVVSLVKITEWGSPTGMSANITWRAHDALLWDYTVLVNGSVADNGLWVSSTMVFTLGPYESGTTWNVTLLASDYFGNTATDTVCLRLEYPLGPYPPPAYSTLLIMGAGGVSAVAVVVLLLVGRRRHAVP